MQRFGSTGRHGAGGTACSRRRFVEGLAAGGTLAACGTWGWPQRAGAAVAELTGRTFELTIGAHPVNVTGTPDIGTLVNGSLPAPTLRWREGDTVTVRVHNTLAEDTSIHWHGIVLPANMDGVPGLSFDGIAPGTTFEYRFDLRQNGTYWYHTHSGFQEQTGLYGALIVEPREAEPFAYEREHVVLLSDWSDLEPARIYGLLKKQSDYFNYNKPTLAYFNRRVRELGLRAALAEQAAWGRMRMDPSDLADVSGHTYTYLLNGSAPNANWTGLFAPGERVRLRFINGSAMTYFDVRIPGLEMTVVAADGQNVHPVTVDEFRIGVAEVLDVIVRPAGGDAFTIFAQSMDRTGYARGTLAVREGLSAPIPELDRVVYLSMADMGHGAPGQHETVSAADHVAMGHAPASIPDAMRPNGAPVESGSDHAAMGHAMPSPGSAPEGMQHSEHAAHAVDHAAMGHVSAAASSGSHGGHGEGSGAGGMQAHPASEVGNPGVDMQTMTPAARLDDPGVGLRGNGRRVLTYADLRSVYADPDGREPGRTIELHLTGHMGRYMWSFDGIRFSDADPIRLMHGERVRVVLVNDTMMEHPIHLHGLWSDLEDEGGGFQMRKHTVSLPPGTRRSYRVTADALGRWAYHCHLLYHMEAGMFREVRVEPAGGVLR